MRLPLLGCLCGAWGGFSFTLVTFFSHRAHGGHGGFKRTVSSPQDSGPSPNPSPAGRGVVCEVTPIGLLTWGVVRSFSHRTHSGPSPNPSPAGRGVICEVTPIGLLVWGVGSFFFHAGDFFLSQSAQSSLSIFAHSFEPTERLRHTEFTERYCQRWL